MQKQEDAVAYANALRRLAKNAYPNTPIQEEVLLGLFIRGLRDKETRNMCI